MDFEHSERARLYMDQVERFVNERVVPHHQTYLDQLAHTDDWRQWRIPAILDQLKAEAKAIGLWNLFLPESEHGAGLDNRDYAPLAEIMGRSFLAPEVFNCSAPDTGNAEVLVRYGSDKQKERWLKPLLDGEIRSGFSMTEPAVASSDATNMKATCELEGDQIVFLLRHRHYDMDNPEPVPITSELAEPMRRALSGESGTVIGLDYRGELVLAAHEPVEGLDLGIVAKIDLAEVRRPFVRAALLAIAIAFVVVLVGAALFTRVSNPMLERIEESEQKYRTLFESSVEAVFLLSDVYVDCNAQAENVLGCQCDRDTANAEPRDQCRHVNAKIIQYQQQYH